MPGRLPRLSEVAVEDGRIERGRRLRQVYSAHVGRSEETAQVSDHAPAERYQQRPPVRVRGEPMTPVADEGARLALASGCEVVIGLGGGSVLDTAKAISGLMTNGGEALDYLEIVGHSRALANPAAPFITEW